MYVEDGSWFGLCINVLWLEVRYDICLLNSDICVRRCMSSLISLFSDDIGSLMVGFGTYLSCIFDRFLGNDAALCSFGVRNILCFSKIWNIEKTSGSRHHCSNMYALQSDSSEQVLGIDLIDYMRSLCKSE